MPAIQSAVADLDLTALVDLSVLVVEDNATNGRVLQETLLGWGMKAELLDAGSKTVQQMEWAKALGTPFALVLLDAHMPDADGFDIAMQIQKNSRLREARLVMLTTIGLRGDAAKCSALGLTATVAKPVKTTELLDAIRLVLGPIDQDQRSRAPATTKYRDEPHPILTILLAEDNPVNQMVASGLLKKRGHTVVLAETGMAALEAIRSQPLDVVLMDVQMPGMEGLEAAVAIRQGEITTGKHLPIIAMIADPMIGDKGHGLRAGMDASVSKPLSGKELFAAIDALLEPPKEPSRMAS